MHNKVVRIIFPENGGYRYRISHGKVGYSGADQFEKRTARLPWYYALLFSHKTTAGARCGTVGLYKLKRDFDAARLCWWKILRSKFVAHIVTS